MREKRFYSAEIVRELLMEMSPRYYRYTYIICVRGRRVLGNFHWLYKYLIGFLCLEKLRRRDDIRLSSLLQIGLQVYGIIPTLLKKVENDRKPNLN